MLVPCKNIVQYFWLPLLWVPSAVACSRTALLEESYAATGIADGSARPEPSSIDASEGTPLDSSVTNGFGDGAVGGDDAGDQFFDASNVVIGSIAPCVGNESIIHLEGEFNDRVHPGTTTYKFPSTGDIWTECGGDKSMDPSLVLFGCPAAVASNTSGMEFYFRSSKGTPIGVGVYQATALSLNDGQPKVSIGASGIYGGYCVGAEYGRFQIEQLEYDVEGAPRRVLVTFEQRCDDSSGLLRGCAYYDQQIAHSR